MKKILSVALAAALAVVVAPGAVRAQAQAGTSSAAADSAYRAARSALTDGDYRRAANLFQQVNQQYASSQIAADALYWRAWSLYKYGADNRTKSDLDAALASVDAYTSRYGNAATMASDAADLRTRIRSAQASLGDASAASDVAQQTTKLRTQSSCAGSRADQETRMAALDGLLSMSSEDAVPILEDVLKRRDACRAEMRRKAVFLLSQKRTANIVPMLLDVARNDPDADVRGDAIFWLSQTRSDAATPALDSILFAPNTDPEIRKKAMFALSQLKDDKATAALRRAAEDEHMSDDLREQAVFWLGQSHTVDLAYFKTLFQKTQNEAIRKKILFAVSQTKTPESGAWLLDVAKDKSADTEMRKEAIFWASQQRLIDLDQLQAIYDQAKGDDEVQKQVLFVYSQRREPAAIDKLIAVAKSDPNLELRKQAIFWLGQKNDPRAHQFLRDLINR